VSPLIDARRQADRLDDLDDRHHRAQPHPRQLSASHERFTTVLEALDASVSVAPLGSEELLFANKLYRQWFGGTTGGHLQLVAQAGVPDAAPATSLDDRGLGPAHRIADHAAVRNAEIYVPELGKWLEVRSRYLNWVDGRLAQMVIATDITARRQAEEQAAAQAERAQSASRLITMGEMASSVAHELNQPLTAINNYCNGMISRIKGKQHHRRRPAGRAGEDRRQAQRAGPDHPAHPRLREAQRAQPHSGPTCRHGGEAVELAEIELRRRNVRLTHYVARAPARAAWSTRS
jgi:signal transduction histidine kinase